MFEASKFVLMDFTRSKMVTHSQLMLCGTELTTTAHQQVSWGHDGSGIMLESSGEPLSRKGHQVDSRVPVVGPASQWDIGQS